MTLLLMVISAILALPEHSQLIMMTMDSVQIRQYHQVKQFVHILHLHLMLLHPIMDGILITQL
jgi:hypothetical protein